MLRRMLYLAQGQVYICVTGASLTRFLNLCAQNGLVLRHMRRTDWNKLYATLSIEDFRALQQYMGRTGCRVHIVKRRGAPFAAAKLWPRRALWGGALALCALCYILTSRVWAIETHIDPALPQAELMQNLNELGVKIGVRRRAVEVRQIRWKLMQRMPEVSFLALNIQGNRLTVEAQSNKEKPDMLDGDAIVKIVAKRDGVIEKMRVQEGSPMVRKGDAVLAGETIISGLVPPSTETGSYHLTHARGIVEARTAYEKTIKRALETMRKTYTGKEKKQYALVFGKKRLNLYLGSGIPGDSCDKIVDVKTLWLSESVVFPVSLIVQTYRYYKCTSVTAIPEDVQQDMEARVLAQLEQNMDGQITAHQQSISEQDGAAVLHFSATALEQIGEEALDDSTIPEPPPEQMEESEQP